MYESIAWAIVKIVAWAVASYYINQALNTQPRGGGCDAMKVGRLSATKVSTHSRAEAAA